jgi:phi13 family phage major tail protein
MANKPKVKFGLKNCYYALLTTGTDGSVTYATPKALKGAVSMSLSAQGDTEKFYADDVTYYTAVGNDGYEGDLELALVDDDFRVDVLGEKLDSTGKVLVENSLVEPAPFALLYEVTTDAGAAKRVFYNCTASRPAENNNTLSGSKTPSTESLTITASPLANGNVRAKTTAETPDTVLSGWYTKVWTPS